jgi:hypothetical protein
VGCKKWLIGSLDGGLGLLLRAWERGFWSFF